MTKTKTTKTIITDATKDLAIATVKEAVKSESAMAASVDFVIPGLSAVIRYIAAHKERKARRYFEVMKSEKFATPEEVGGYIQAHVQEPYVWDTIHKAMRALYDSPVPETAVPLGMLTAEYMSEEKQPDGFFRGFCDLLVCCTRPELEQLCEIWRAADALTKTEGSTATSLRLYSSQGEPNTAVLATEVAGEVASRDTAVGGCPDHPLVLRRLARFELVDELNAWGAPTYRLSLRNARRIWVLLRNMEL